MVGCTHLTTSIKSNMLLSLITASVLFALVPALLADLRAYAPPPCPPAGQEFPPVSVLIPARNEENAIGDAVRAALRNQGIGSRWLSWTTTRKTGQPRLSSS